MGQPAHIRRGGHGRRGHRRRRGHSALDHLHGVRHPATVSTSVPSRPPTAAAPTNTALVHAEAAYGRAVRAAAEYAAAHAAAELVGAEVISTRHRVRALRRHWIARLREALDRSDLALKRAEHEDSVRWR
ncbi:V-type ATP synthase subunit D [Streptomyces pristinaespiralis]|uniref:V-type ATP synthase subunit D n=1 Tax=Streptomyces pristinaespiralis TaxID=38300 RepID=UPI0033C8C16B